MAPPYVVLEVNVRLANGHAYTWRWTMARTLGRAVARGRGLAVARLRADKVPGRSQIVGIRVEARLRNTGDWTS
jgi:hypothetical protein